MLDYVLFTKIFCTEKEYIERIQNYENYKQVLNQVLYKTRNYKYNEIKKFICDVKDITGTTFEEYNATEFLNEVVFYNKIKYTKEYEYYFVLIIKKLLDTVRVKYFSNDKIFYTMIIFRLIETEFGEEFMFLYPKFKNTVQNKITEFLNLISYPKFTKYLNERYDTKFIYISKERNKKYYRSLLRTTLFSLITFNSLYRKIKNKNNSNCIIS